MPCIHCYVKPGGQLNKAACSNCLDPAERKAQAMEEALLGATLLLIDANGTVHRTWRMGEVVYSFSITNSTNEQLAFNLQRSSGEVLLAVTVEPYSTYTSTAPLGWEIRA